MITDKNKKLEYTHPHYSDFRFGNGQELTIFGEEKDGLQYEYSDHIAMLDREAKKNSEEVADRQAPRLTATWYEAYLSAHFEKPVEVHHIISGVNRGDGYPYRIYGFKFKE